MGFWERGEHIGNFNFRIEIEGLHSASFKQMEGMGTETEVIEYGKLPRRKRPGQHKCTDITFKRGYTTSTELWEWRKSVIEGNVLRKSGSIIVCDDDGSEISRFNFFDAWPTKWKGFQLDGKGTEGLVEELTITLERLDKG